jgi:DNA polymerase II large subunit
MAKIPCEDNVLHKVARDCVKHGYHLAAITRGTFGDLSKVYEEIEEVKDAEKQDNPVMVLLELSDAIGAIRGYLRQHHPELSLTDLIIMADATERAFLSGSRK